VDEVADRDLLEAVRAGDAEALETLLVRYQPRIYRFSMKMCRHPEDARDVVQDTLLAVARGVRSFKGASSLSTWLYTIARSFCIKHRRRSKFAPPAELSLETDVAEEALGQAAPGPGLDEVMESRRIETAVERAIAGLAPTYREVLVLRDVEGLTAGEVAEVTGLSVDAVKSRLHRARSDLRRRLAPALGAAPPAAPGTEPCPDIVRLFSRHLEGEIGADVCAEMERHLAACPRCRTACDSLKRTLSLCQAMPVPAVPRDVQEAVRASIRSVLSGQA
jgi:RNA polymerase sigma-70 factor (ECF subfamily)